MEKCQKKKLKSAVLFIFLAIALISFTSAIDYNWNFSTSSDYIYNTSQIVVNGGMVYLNGSSNLFYAWYHLNETNGTIIQDSSSNGRNGTLINNGTWVTGKLNNGLQFAGTQYADFGNVANFERNNSFSVELWIKTSDTDGTLFGRRENSVNFRGWDITYSGGKLYVSIASITGTERISVYDTFALANNNWHHVIFTYNGSSLASGVKMYIDGGLRTLVVAQNNLNGTILNSVNCQLGTRASSGTNLMNGIYDEVVIYNFVLSSADVTLRYNSGSGTENRINDYLTGFYTLQPKNNFSILDSLVRFNETAIKTSSDIKYAVTINGTFQYWNGTNWTFSDGSWNQSNNVSVINSNIASLGITGNFSFQAILHSNDGSLTPYLDNILASQNSYPSIPSIISPLQNFYHGNITINYTISISPDGNPVNYNITLLNGDNSFNQTLILNYSSLIYIFNSQNFSLEDYFYKIKITACNIGLLCVSNTSELILIDNTPPYAQINSPVNNSILNQYLVNFQINVTDNLNVTNITFYFMNGSGMLNITEIQTNTTSGIFDVLHDFIYDGVYYWFVKLVDSAGNIFESLIRTFTIDTGKLNVTIDYPINGSVYNYIITNLIYHIDGNTQSCYYSTNEGITNHTFNCNLGQITGIQSNEGNNTWFVYANNSFGNESIAYTSFQSFCTNPNVVVTTTSYPYIEQNTTYTIILSSFVYGNSNIKLLLTDQNSTESLFNFTFNNLTNTYSLSLFFNATNDYQFNIFGDNICPTVVTNITGTFFVRNPYFVTVEGFKDSVGNIYKNEFAYVIAEPVHRTMTVNGLTYIVPIQFKETYNQQVLSAPYINGVATLKLYDSGDYYLRLFDGQATFKQTLSVPNITETYGTNVYIGKYNLNNDTTFKVLLNNKDLHPWSWLFMWLMIIAMVVVTFISLVLLFKFPENSFLALIFFIFFQGLIITVRVLVWIFWYN